MNPIADQKTIPRSPCRPTPVVSGEKRGPHSPIALSLKLSSQPHQKKKYTRTPFREPGASGAGFAPRAFDFDFFLCLLRPQKPFSPPLRPFNPQFRPFTANHLARQYPHAILVCC